RREFVNWSTLGYLAPFAAIWLVFVARRSLLLLLTTAITAVFALYAVTASNCQWMHYYNMTMSGLFFTLLVGLDSMTRELRSVTIQRLFGLVLLGTVAVVMMPRLTAERRQLGTRTFSDPYQELVPGALTAIKRYTMPSDRIFTTGVPILY